MPGIQLVHDVLDAQLIDRDKEKIGRVDELTIELRDDGPPRVSTILTGGMVRARRVGRWKVALDRSVRALFHVDSEGVDRIPFRKLRCLSDTIQLDVDRRELESQHVEAWLADHVICRIPASRRPKE